MSTHRTHRQSSVRCCHSRVGSGTRRQAPSAHAADAGCAAADRRNCTQVPAQTWARPGFASVVKLRSCSNCNSGIGVVGFGPSGIGPSGIGPSGIGPGGIGVVGLPQGAVAHSIERRQPCDHRACAAVDDFQSDRRCRWHRRLCAELSVGGRAASDQEHLKPIGEPAPRHTRWPCTSRGYLTGDFAGFGELVRIRVVESVCAQRRFWGGPGQHGMGSQGVSKTRLGLGDVGTHQPSAP